MLLLFGADPELFAYAARHYRRRSEETSTLLLQLLNRYQREGIIMADPLAEFARETIDNLLQELPLERRLRGVPLEKRLEGVAPEDVWAALSPQAREALIRRIQNQGGAADAK